MKRFSFLQVALMVAFVVIAASCTVTRGYDEYYEDEPVRRNSTSRVIIVERDPYTGRYYEVDRFGNYVGSVAPYSAHDRYYSNRYYNDRYYGNGYRNYDYNRNYNNNYRGGNTNNPQAEQRREESKKKINEARDVIRGRSN